MNFKIFLLILGFSIFGLSVACGGGSEEISHEAETATENIEEAESASFELGGGIGMEIHPGQAGSPHVKTDWNVGDASISITYGRPFLKDRIVGESVEPMSDRVWRLGADEATILVTDTDIMLGDSHVPAGEYSLFTQHMNDEFHLIVNSETGQWGTAYNSDNDVAHVAMEVTELNPPAEQLTFSIADGHLGFEWGQMAASVALMTH